MDPKKNAAQAVTVTPLVELVDAPAVPTFETAEAPLFAVPTVGIKVGEKVFTLKQQTSAKTNRAYVGILNRLNKNIGFVKVDWVKEEDEVRNQIRGFICQFSDIRKTPENLKDGKLHVFGLTLDTKPAVSKRGNNYTAIIDTTGEVIGSVFNRRGQLSINLNLYVENK